MSVRLLLFFPLWLCVAITFGDEPSGVAYHNEFYLTSGKLLLPNGKPAANTTMTIRSVDRVVVHSPGYMNAFPSETFVTDGNGSFTLVIPKQIQQQDGGGLLWKLQNLYAIVEPAKDHPGLIRGIGTGEQLTSKRSDSDLAEDSSKSNNVTWRIPKPGTLRVRLLGKSDKPLQDVRVIIFHDLHADTHTGRGGEIWERTATTDENGRAAFSNVYPDNISIQPEAYDYGAWTTTTLFGKTVGDVLDEISFPPGTSQVELTARFAPKGTYVLYGKVTDSRGRPVPDAPVVAGVMRHKKERTYEDSHSTCRTLTQADGTYRLEVPTPWLFWAYASAWDDHNLPNDWRAQNRNDFADKTRVHVEPVEIGQRDFVVPVEDDFPGEQLPSRGGR